MSNQPAETSQIQTPGQVAVEIQKPGHIFRAYAASVQAQSQAAQCHEEIVLAIQEQSGITRPGHDPAPSPQGDITRPLGQPLQEALLEVAAASQALARASNTLRLLISRPTH